MKLQRDKLHQYQKRVAVLTTRETEIARECLAKGKKDKALLALRRKKFQESLLSKADAQLEQLQRLMADVEFAQMQAGVLEGLKQGTQVLNQIHAEMGGIERVERLLEENAEARAYEREVTELLGGQLSVADEEDVEEELERLRVAVEGPKEEEREETVAVLPNVPKVQPVGRIGQEEEGEGERRKATERQAMLA